MSPPIDSAAQAGIEERFELEELLGSGAMGTVYRAVDRAHGNVVALKQLKRADARALFSFKAEFRNLSNLSHPNLLQLYELVTRGDDWFLTMELVLGTDFLRFVRPCDEADSDAEDDEELSSLDESTDPGADATPRGAKPNVALRAPLLEKKRAPRKLGELDEARLRSCMSQLAEGLRALHAEHYLHRDLKPDNVLVFEQTGRLVICDFGLVVEAKVGLQRAVSGGTDGASTYGSSTGTGRSALGELAGTLAFMAPEQASGLALTEAADWYAVGVMLYMALTLKVPIAQQRTFEEAARAKREQPPRDPRELNPDAPDDLSELALALLHPDPSARAGYEQVSARLSSEPGRRSIRPRTGEVLLGRASQLAQLNAAFARAKASHCSQVFVSGASGMGKSAVMRHFLFGAESQGGAIVLSARCYEREELPYKAFDPLVDALSSYLLTCDEPLLNELLPPNIESLASMFPTLCRLPLLQARMAAQEGSQDLLERRRLAADALWELCRRISRKQPLILYIDDLQWGDLDSAAFFARFHFITEPSAMLLVCAYRSEDRARSPLLSALWASGAERGSELEQVSVEALAEHDATELVRMLLPADAEHQQLAPQIVSEALGSPFFIHELVAYVRERGVLSGSESLRLEQVVRARLDALSADSRMMLDVVAVAGRPERRAILEAACNLGPLGFDALRMLERQSLVQSGGAGADARIEAYHDRIRETAYEALGSERRVALHRRLAEALELKRDGANEAEALFKHWKAAGDGERARRYAIEAAESAERSAAFGRAAALFEEAARLLPAQNETWSWLQERRAQALVLAGRGVDAAAAFEQAAGTGAGERPKALRVRGQVELLRAGRVDAALAGLALHAEATGLRLPKTDLGSILMLLLRRLRIRFMRRPKLQPEQSVPSALAARVDRLWEIASSLASVDFLRGNVYSAELTICALRARGARQLAFAYAMESVNAAAGAERKRCDDFAARCIDFAGQNDSTYVKAVSSGTVGVARLLCGEWAEARRLAQESQRMHRTNPVGAWDVATMVFWDLQAAAQLGEVADLTRQIPEALRDADSRGDLFASTYFRTMRSTWAWLGPDQTATVRAELATAERNWTPHGYQLPHYYITLSYAELDLYEGRPAASLERLRGEWKRGTLLRNIQHARCELRGLRGRLCLAQARERHDPALLRMAHDDARALAREGRPWPGALGVLLLAGLASFDDRDKALALLQRAATEFDGAGMKLHARAADHRRGQLLANAEGEALVLQSAAAIAACGVKRPENFVRMLAPGFAAPA
ncbi:MAG: serine/threonine protein kinase [Myxococcaceae bacterium]|nr:serine/threonine protein kinase [Myxococcaceae bacterium]